MRRPAQAFFPWTRTATADADAGITCGARGMRLGWEMEIGVGAAEMVGWGTAVARPRALCCVAETGRGQGRNPIV